MQLKTVGCACGRTVLVDAVKEVCHRLVGDEQMQEAETALLGQGPEQSSAVGAGSLVRERAEGIVAKGRVGD